MTASRWFSIRRTSRLCLAPSARRVESTRSGRLELVVPESAELLERAFADGESAPHQIAHLLQLLDRYGARAMRGAVREALERNTPRAASVEFLLRQSNRTAPLPLDLRRHPQAESVCRDPLN